MATTAPDRYLSLDAIRGFAVMGIVLMNIFFFSMPGAAYYNPRSWGGLDIPDLCAWALSFVFIEDKMKGLFLLLFGASAMLVIDKARATGRNALGVHSSRMLWLLVFGLLHGLFLANNDILRLYAITGLLLPFFAKASARALIVWIIGLLTLHLALFGYIALNWLEAYDYVQAHPEEAALLAFPERAFGVDNQAIEAQLALYRGPYWPIVESRLAGFAGLALGLAALLPITLAGMLVGVALFRTGFFTGEWNYARLRRWAIWCFIIAAAPLALLAIWAFASDFAGAIIGANALAWSTPFDMVMTIGWAAVLMLLVTRSAKSAWTVRIAATGRMAFTNYIGTSVILVPVFYGFGLELYGHIGRIEAYLFVAAIWTLMLLWSKPWLDRFRYGPLEWLWRSLSRRRFEPLRGPATS